MLCHTLMLGLSTCGNRGDPVTFVVGQPEFSEVTKHYFLTANEPNQTPPVNQTPPLIPSASGFHRQFLLPYRKLFEGLVIRSIEQKLTFNCAQALFAIGTKQSFKRSILKITKIEYKRLFPRPTESRAIFFRNDFRRFSEP